MCLSGYVRTIAERVTKGLLLLLAALALSQCKSPTAVITDQNPSLLRGWSVLDTAVGQFSSLYQQSVDEKAAFVQTVKWLQGQPGIHSAMDLDSSTITITTDDGLVTNFSVYDVDADGHTTTRGGDLASQLASFASNASHTIENKHVLIFAPAFSEFYSDSDMQKIVGILSSSRAGLDVTVLRDSDATVYALNHLGEYGLVILDTHGHPDDFKAGKAFLIDGKPLSEDELSALLDRQGGSNTSSMLRQGDLRFGAAVLIAPDKHRVISRALYPLVSTRYLSKLPTIEHTVLFGNMCYSGWSATKINRLVDGAEYVVERPILPTILAWRPISYYCYVNNRLPGTSSIVSNTFAKSMEEHLVTRLAKDLDSTGIANLTEDNSTEYSEVKSAAYDVTLFFRRFGAPDYSYGGCVDTFTDARDGTLYHAVCIGDQTWMAENLAYAAPESVCYDNDAGNCATYGRLYNWTTVMQGAAPTNAVPSGVRGICPKGWHLPSSAEFAKLLAALGGPNKAGAALKDTSLWKVDPALPSGSTNSSGFSARPAGFQFDPGHFQELTTGTAYWSTTEFSRGSGSVLDLQLNYQSPKADLGTPGVPPALEKTYYTSCRCLEDK